MMDTPTPASTTPISDYMRRTGSWNPAWDALADLDATYTEKFLTMAGHAVSTSGLDPLTIEFISIAVDASCTHMYAPGTRRHIHNALKAGATVEEIMEVLKLCVVHGVQACNLGVPILSAELARRRGAAA